MNSLIQEIFKEIDIECFYLTRKNEQEECVVFTHIQSPGNFSDNEMEDIEYTVLLNFYCKSNLENKKNKILKEMIKNGFKLISIKASLIDKSGFYNTPLQFKKNVYLRKDDV